MESDNSVMDESNNLGFLQVYSLTQLIQGLWQDLDVSNKQKKVDSDFVQMQLYPNGQIYTLNVKFIQCLENWHNRKIVSRITFFKHKKVDRCLV